MAKASDWPTSVYRWEIPLMVLICMFAHIIEILEVCPILKALKTYRARITITNNMLNEFLLPEIYKLLQSSDTILVLFCLLRFMILDVFGTSYARSPKPMYSCFGWLKQHSSRIAMQRSCCHFKVVCLSFFDF